MRRSFSFKVPTFRYPGGKSRASKLFVAKMPKYGSVYCEPFAGRGNVFFRARSSGLNYDRWILNDATTAPFFQGLMDPEIIAKIPMAVTKAGALEWNRLAKAGDEVAQVINARIGFSGMIQSGRAGDQRIRQWNKGGSRRFCSVIRNARRVLCWPPTAEIWDQDGLKVIRQANRGWFMYVDPPYLGCYPKLYTRCDGQEKWHRDLIKQLMRATKRSAHWMLSGYRTSLYLDMIGEPTFTYADRLTASRYKPGEKHKRTEECVWQR